MSDHSPTNEAAKEREQRRDFEAEKHLLANKVYAEQRHAHRMNAFGNVREYGTLSIRTLFFLHGGAMIALLGFISSLIGKGENGSILIASSMALRLKPAFYCFGSGIMLSAVVAFIAYVNWSSVAESYETPSQLFDLILSGRTETTHPRYYTISIWTVWIAVAVGFTSLGLFGWGVVIIAGSFVGIGA